MKNEFRACADQRTLEFPAVILSANGLPDTPVSKVHDPITWQAIRFTDGGQECYLVAGDFLSLGTGMRDIAEAALPDVPPENILLFASHTHTAPAIDRDLPVLGEAQDAAIAVAGAALHTLLTELSQKELHPAVIRSGVSRCDNNVYRRRRIWRPAKLRRQMAMAPDESVQVPTEVRYLSIEQERGEPIAGFWTWPCHPTGFPLSDQMSADFPGLVRQHLADHGKSVSTLFGQGFCGDIRPALYDRASTLKGRAKRLLNGLSFGNVPVSTWSSWAGEVAGAVAEARSDARRNPAVTPSPITAFRNTIPLDALQDRAIDGRSLSVQFLRLAEGVEFLALGCEPSHGLVPALHDAGLSRDTVMLGYTDHIYGYLPTSAQVTEGGYEADGFRHNFSLPGQYAADTTERLTAALSPMIQRITATRE